MANLPKNETEVKNFLLPKISNAVEYVLNQIYLLNQWEIEQVVYAAYNPKEYIRTGEFKNTAWSYDKPKISGTHVKGTFQYDPEGMEYVPELAQHGSPIDYTPSDTAQHYGDEREYLAEIIYGGLSGMLFGDGPWRNKRDAWEAVLKALRKQDLRKWIKEGLELEGLKVRDNRTTMILEKKI